jgi:hypothetical protein
MTPLDYFHMLIFAFDYAAMMIISAAFAIADAAADSATPYAIFADADAFRWLPLLMPPPR